MIYLLDTANIEEIKRINEYFPLDGVTTNPTIIARENGDFKKIIENIFNVLGTDKMVHGQVVGYDASTMIKEAKLLRDTFGENFYVKIPVTMEGIKAIKELGKEGYKITATGILSPQQILMAAEAGAEYMAPYINRSDNIGENGIEIVRDAYKMLELCKKSPDEMERKYKRVFEPKILGASFKNVRQVHETIMAGAKSVTVGTDVFEKLIYHPYTDWSMDTFNNDWKRVYGEKNILDLL